MNANVLLYVNFVFRFRFRAHTWNFISFLTLRPPTHILSFSHTCTHSHTHISHWCFAANILFCFRSLARNRCNRSHVYIKSHRIKVYIYIWVGMVRTTHTAHRCSMHENERKNKNHNAAFVSQGFFTFVVCISPSTSLCTMSECIYKMNVCVCVIIMYIECKNSIHAHTHTNICHSSIS